MRRTTVSAPAGAPVGRVLRKGSQQARAFGIVAIGRVVIGRVAIGRVAVGVAVGVVGVGVLCLLPDAAVAASPAGGATGTQLVRLALGLAAVIGLLLVSARLLPRLGGGALVGSDALRVVAQLQVGQRERVVVLQVGERQIMVGVAPGRVEMLYFLEEPLPGRERGTGTAGMPGWLGRTLTGRRP